MELARVTAKGRTTISKRIREAAHIWEGDMLAFDLDSNNRIPLSVSIRSGISHFQ